MWKQRNKRNSGAAHTGERERAAIGVDSRLSLRKGDAAFAERKATPYSDVALLGCGDRTRCFGSAESCVCQGSWTPRGTGGLPRGCQPIDPVRDTAGTMPALPTAKWQMLRSLGVTRDGRAVEGLLASCEALTRGCLLGTVSFRRPGVLCLRVSESEGENRLLRRSCRYFRGAKGDRERRRKDCCCQPRVITGLACVRARLGRGRLRVPMCGGVRGARSNETVLDLLGWSSRAEGDRLRSPFSFSRLTDVSSLPAVAGHDMLLCIP